MFDISLYKRDERLHTFIVHGAVKHKLNLSNKTSGYAGTGSRNANLKSIITRQFHRLVITYADVWPATPTSSR